MPSPMFLRVLVGWDGSSGAAEGLRLGCRLTHGAHGCVTALAVVPAFAHIDAAEDRAQAVATSRSELQEAFDQVVAGQPLADGQRAVVEFVESGDVAKAIDRYAAEHPVELIIVGLHGREGILHPRMGHIASHAVRSSNCPVLTVPDPEASSTVDVTESSLVTTLLHPFRRHRERV